MKTGRQAARLFDQNYRYTISPLMPNYDWSKKDFKVLRLWHIGMVITGII
jgi:hypothetical protein